jgi:protein-tyrosine phosphatase
MPSPHSFHVLAVCVGNVCRPPIMERLLGQRMPWASVESAGVSAVVGSDMHPQSRLSLGRLGGNVDAFEARQVNAALVDRADLILTADTYVRGRVLEEHPRARERTFTLRELAIVVQDAPTDVAGPVELVRWASVHRSLAGGRRIDIADPIGRSEEAHARAAQLVDEHTALVAQALTDARARAHREGNESASRR